MRFISILFLLGFLAACGGGVGSSSPTSTIAPNLAYPGSVRYITPLSAFVHTAAADCSDFVCAYDILSEPTTVDLYDLDPTGALKPRLGQTQVTNGISQAVATFRDEGVDYNIYAGWGQYHAFVDVYGRVSYDDATLELMLPVAMGDAYETNPVAGSATWIGRMVGRWFEPGGTFRPSADIGGRVTGDAAVVADFAAMDVDLTFSRIVGPAGRPLNDLRWTDLPIRRGGFDGEGVYALFYGPDHEEVGGIFELDNIAGAFGAVRANR